MRSKAKEKCIQSLVYIFPDVNLQQVAGTPKLQKISRQDILKPYAQKGEMPRFIYVPLVYEDDGQGQKKMVSPPKDPFHSPYILRTFEILWFGENARWKGFQSNSITASQLAFVCKLVRYLSIYIWNI